MSAVVEASLAGGTAEALEDVVGHVHHYAATALVVGHHAVRITIALVRVLDELRAASACIARRTRGTTGHTCVVCCSLHYCLEPYAEKPFLGGGIIQLTLQHSSPSSRRRE